jgi:hypothetical protein
MTEQLISFETAKLAKEKGFNWKCYQAYDWISGFPGNTHTGYNNWNKFGDGKASAPTQSLLQKWLRDEHKIFVSVERCVIGSDEWEFGYFIDYLPKEHFEDKRRVGSFKEIRSFEDDYPYSYSGAWYTWEQALEEGLKKSLELL